MAEKYCRIVQWDYPARDLLPYFDGYFLHNKLKLCPDADPTIAYFNWCRNTKELVTAIEHWEPFNPKKIIFLNEAFQTNGRLRGKESKEWIIEKFRVLRRSFPDAELWITDHKPQSMPLWNGLREFLADTNLPVDGVGIHCYLELDRPAIIAATIAIYTSAISIQTAINRSIAKTAFSEVGVFPKTDGRGIVEGYNAIITLSKLLDVKWVNFWFLTDFDSGHWDPTKVRDCGLFDRDYQLKEGLNLWH
jgi:GH35 family endo-1,4-beta-xylanase